MADLKTSFNLHQLSKWPFCFGTVAGAAGKSNSTHVCKRLNVNLNNYFFLILLSKFLVVLL